MSSATTLPRWDVSAVFPSLESPAFATGFADVIRQVDALTALFDTLGVERLTATPATDDAIVAAVEQAINALNETMAPYRTLSAYIYSFVTTDSRNTLAQARQSELQRQGVRLAQLRTRFTAWIGSMDVETLVARSQIARDHAFTLREAQSIAARLMSPEEEALAAELNVSGGAAGILRSTPPSLTRASTAPRLTPC